MKTGRVSEVADLLARRIGLRLDTAMAARLARCLAAEAMEQSMTVEAVAENIHRDPLAQQRLLNRVTVQESWFFRDVAQFEALVTHVLPDCPRPVRIWVAGCANGQEAYTLAMVLAEAHQHDAQIIATDVSTGALERTRRGRFYERDLRGLSAERRARFLRPSGDQYVVTGELRDLIQVRHQNLVTDPVPLSAGTASLVFCRNVLIYFRPEEVPGTVGRIASALPPGGLLFGGVSEAQWQVGNHFELIRLGNAFVYRRGDPAGIPSAAPAIPRQTRLPMAVVPPPAAAEFAAAALQALHAGEQASAAGDNQRAVIFFRQAAYLKPALPMAHFQLGMALEFSGDHTAAARAYGAAARSLAHDDVSTVDLSAQGYSPDVLRRLLETKLMTWRGSS